MGNSLTLCPFCDKPYKRLGSHLRYCSMRKGRDYSIYLSQKTLNKKISNKSTPCPTCGKKFARLDVHLRGSATCKQQFGEPTSPTQSELDPVPLHVQLESTQTSSNQYLVASANNCLPALSLSHPSKCRIALSNGKILILH